MLKRTAKQTSLESFVKKICSAKFKNEWLSDLVETELITSAGNGLLNWAIFSSIMTRPQAAAASRQAEKILCKPKNRQNFYG